MFILQLYYSFGLLVLQVSYYIRLSFIKNVLNVRHGLI